MIARPYYSKKVIEHFSRPKNFGEMKGASGVGRVGNPRCGDLMKLYIKVENKGNKEIIKDIKFHTLGCAAAIAASDMICELAKGKTLDQAVNIGFQDVSNELGTLPPLKIHCAQLVTEALRDAIGKYPPDADK